MSDRATLKELHEFANKVRAAGGGNPLDALMPAVPQEPTQCLIAKNLNFNCNVVPADELDDEGNGIWWMSLDDKDTAEKISTALNLELIESEVKTPIWDKYYRKTGENVSIKYRVVLPYKIGAVAAAFDEAQNCLQMVGSYIEDDGYGKRRAWDTLDRSEKKLVRDMLPYIEQATKEAYGIATLVTDEGKIVI